MRSLLLGAAVAYLALISPVLAKTTHLDILTGRVDGTLDSFETDDGAADYLDGAGFHVSRYDGGRNVVSKFTDKEFLDCAKNAGIPLGADGISVIGAGTKHPVISGGAAFLDKVVDASGVKSMSECNAAWLEKLSEARDGYRFTVISAQVGQMSVQVAEIVSRVLELGSRQSELELRITGGIKAIDTRLKGIEADAAAASAQTKTALNELAAELKTQKAKFEEEALAATVAARIEERRATVEASVMAASIIGKFVFANNPVAAARFEAGMGSVHKIADSIVSLCKPGLSDGAKLLLSANIASGAIGLVGLIGSSKSSESAMLMEQLSAIRSDISSLRAEMNERFDRVEKLITDVTAHLDKRLDKIDSKLERLVSDLEKVANDVDSIVVLGHDAFRFLIVDKYAELFRQCGRNIALVTLPADRVHDCLESAVTYGTRGSSLAVVSAAAVYDKNLALDDAVAIALEMDEGDRPAYLEMALRDAVRRGAWQHTLPAAGSTVSPQAWADAVDILGATLAKTPSFKSMTDAGLTTEIVAADFADDIGDLIEKGEASRETVRDLRVAGVEFALTRYVEAVYAFGQAVSASLTEELSSKDLGIFETRQKLWAMETTGDGSGPYGADGLVRLSIRYFRDQNYHVAKGPEAGSFWQVAQRETAFAGWNQIMCQACEGSYAKQETELMNNDISRAGSLSLNFTRSVLDYPAELKVTNQTYIRSVPLAEYPEAGRKAFDAAFDEASHAESFVKQCTAIGRSRSVVGLFANLLRSSYGDVDNPWLELLEALPGTEADGGCSALVASMRKRIGETSPEVLEKSVIRSALSAVNSGIESFRSAYSQGDHTGNLVEIDRRLEGLRALLN